jgi:Hint domain
MMPNDTPFALPGQAFQVIMADDLYVAQGANLGDALAGPAQVCLGDVYELEPGHRALRLVLTQGDARLAAGSEVGTAGDVVTLEARYTLMTPDGDRVELAVLRVGDLRCALPLSPMAARTEYALLVVDTAPAAARLTDLLNVSFARGTMIALSSGEQRAIEDLRVGDRILTRDHGGQPIVWIGRATLRAVGAFAPVVIPKGALGNAGDLIVSQHHRMFLYQRERKAGLATAELLVQAKHLADGDRIFIREGGYVDYFSLIFAGHEIIYAEGVPAESLMVTEATVNRLPPELAAEVKARFPGLNQNQHFGTEAGRAALDVLAQRKGR